MPNIQKVESEMNRLISIVILRELKDQTIKFVTVTDVKVKKDLSVATVFYTVLGQDAKREAVHRSLIKAKGYIKGVIAKRMKLRRVPDLEFEYDKSLDYGNKIDSLLRNL
ncbi:30S ribosome-binding factor RbfA [Mycoplasmatota bacterium WC44]